MSEQLCFLSREELPTRFRSYNRPNLTISDSNPLLVQSLPRQLHLHKSTQTAQAVELALSFQKSKTKTPKHQRWNQKKRK